MLCQQVLAFLNTPFGGFYSDEPNVHARDPRLHEKPTPN